MPDKKAILQAAGAYLKQHPEELVRALRSVAALRLGVPLDALRWLALQAKGRRAPKDIEIEAVPPGIRLAATVDAMGTALRASAIVYVDRVSINASELRFELRLAEVGLKVLDENSESPIAGLLKSGALDLSKPGNLVGFMPKRPAVLVEAVDDRVVLDLKKLPKLQNGKAARLLDALTPFLTVAAVESDVRHLDVQFRTFPEGIGEAVNALRRAL